MEWTILGAAVLSVILLLVLVFRRDESGLQKLRLSLAKDLQEQQMRQSQATEQSLQSLRMESDKKFSMFQNQLEQNLEGRMNTQTQILRELEKALLEQNHEAQEKILRELVSSIQTMTKVNDEKLKQIHGESTEKLDKSLNERLDSSFEKIGTQLGQLYKTVGELQTLTNGVENLNRTLSNVKTRGTWGEMQLEQILSNIFPESLYDKNVEIKKNSGQRVEFALKIPDKTEGERFIYLPIDSKFPADLYDKIQEAAVQADRKAMDAAVKELEGRIKAEAREIEKYIDPPVTTDFAIMFLPAEGLYSEVLRIPGLAEYCQQVYKVVISGPTTVSALLNSLAIGFKFLTVSRNTKEVLKVLQNIRGQYSKFGELIDKTQRNLDLAVRSTEDMKKRSDMIQKRLERVSTLELPGEEMQEEDGLDK